MSGQGALKSIAYMAKQPITWCLAIHISLAELISFSLADATTDGSPYSAGSVVTSTAVAAVLYGTLILVSFRTKSLSRFRWLTAFSATLGGAGSLASVWLSPAGSLTGFAAAVVGAELLLVQILERLASMNMEQVRSAVAVSALINALFALAYESLSASAPFMECSLFAICALLLMISKTKEMEPQASRIAVIRRKITFPYAIMAGLALVIMCFSFLQSQLYLESSTVVTGVIASTKIAAVGIFLAIMISAHESGYGKILKTVAVFVSIALAFHLSETSRYATYAFVATGYSLFELVMYLSLAHIASYSTVPPLRLFSVFTLFVNVFYAAGGMINQITSSVGDSGTYVATAMISSLIAIAIWQFDEKKVNAFFWGEAADKNDTLQKDDKRIAKLVEIANLSPREAEILELYAKGRSAAFIGELLSLSPNTVRSHISHIYEKCMVHSRQELISLIEKSN